MVTVSEIKFPSLLGWRLTGNVSHGAACRENTAVTVWWNSGVSLPMTLMGNAVGNVSGDVVLSVLADSGNAEGVFIAESDIGGGAEIQAHQLPVYSAL